MKARFKVTFWCIAHDSDADDIADFEVAIREAVISGINNPAELDDDILSMDCEVPMVIEKLTKQIGKRSHPQK
jgi:hypothetical protein